MSTTTTPYVAIAARIRQFCTELGLPQPVAAATPSGLPENAGWMFVQFSTDRSAAALIIQKTQGRAPNIHSHLDLQGLDGFIELPRLNGRVLCHFECDLNKVRAVLHLFVDSVRRPVRASSKTPGKAQAASIPGLSLDSDAASETPVHGFTEEEIEEEMAMIEGRS